MLPRTDRGIVAPEPGLAIVRAVREVRPQPAEGTSGRTPENGSPAQRSGRPRAVEDPEENGASDGAGEAPKPTEERPAKGGRSQKARKSQVELLRTLLVEARGPDGVERMEKHLGKPITELTRQEADSWIDRLTPEDRE